MVEVLKENIIDILIVLFDIVIKFDDLKSIIIGLMVKIVKILMGFKEDSEYDIY